MYGAVKWLSLCVYSSACKVALSSFPTDKASKMEDHNPIHTMTLTKDSDSGRGSRGSDRKRAAGLSI